MSVGTRPPPPHALHRQRIQLPGTLTFLAHFVSASDFTGDILASMLPAEILDSLHLEPDDFHQARRQFFAGAENHK